MSLLAAAVLWAGGAVDVWAADALAPIGPETVAPSPDVHEYRIYVTRGEYEALQIAIRADEALDNVTIEAPPLGRRLPRPDVFRVGYVAGANGLAADPLYPVNDVEPVPANVTTLFWLRYQLPADARARVYETEITVQYGKRRRQNIALTAEVFDVVLPEVPALRTLYTLSLEPIAERYGWPIEISAAWENLYQRLAPYRIAATPVWDAAAADLAEIWQAHIKAQYDAAPLSTIGMTPLIDSDAPDLPADTLAWLAGNSAAGRAVVAFEARSPRRTWPEVARNVASVRERYPELDVLLAAPLHPGLAALPDIWAMPIGALHPAAITLLQDNRTLAAPVTVPAAAVAASTEDTDAPAADGYDGSFFSGWQPAGGNPTSIGTWWQVDLARPAEVSTLRLAFAPNALPPSPELLTTHDAQHFVPATVTWAPRAASTPTDFNWLEGKLSVAKTTVALRLVFPATSGSDWKLVELQLGDAPPLYPTRAAMTAPELWLDVSRSTAIFDPGAHTVHRLLPALCWHYGLTGILGPPLADWPADWTARTAGEPLPAPPSAQSTLWYPGAGGPVPSIRLELLRDGIEDYGLLTRLEEAIAAGEVDEEEAESLLSRTWIDPDLDVDALDSLIEEWRDRRVSAGRLLTGW